jgi:hypothetical protein
MTMRTYRYFTCPNGHEGIEKTSENDQPYSKNWESVLHSGMIAHKQDQKGFATYLCETCKLPMSENKTS